MVFSTPFPLIPAFAFSAPLGIFLCVPHPHLRQSLKTMYIHFSPFVLLFTIHANSTPFGWSSRIFHTYSSVNDFCLLTQHMLYPSTCHQIFRCKDLFNHKPH